MTKLSVALLLSFSMLTLASNAQQPEQTELSDEALLEDLGAELLEPSQDETLTPLEEQLIEQLGGDLGEDSNSSKQDDQLSQIVGHMRRAQTILERSAKSGGASAAQAEALTGIDAMIAELTERKSKCSGGKKSSKSSSSKSGKKSSSSGKAGTSPARSASGTTNSGADLSTELAVAGELVMDLWGQLPQRQREQILQPLSEGFLPKYASEIEAYFRALADPERVRAEAQ